MPPTRPTELELQVLGVLWDRGGSTVREVLEALPDGKQRAYTTVLTVLQQMEKKGLLRHTREKVTHVFYPRVARAEITTPVVRALLRTVFGGDPSAVVQSLIDSGDVDEDQIKEIRRVINAAAKKAREEGDE